MSLNHRTSIAHRNLLWFGLVNFVTANTMKTNRKAHINEHSPKEKSVTPFSGGANFIWQRGGGGFPPHPA